MNYQKRMPKELLDILASEGRGDYGLDYYAYPQTWGNTAGPRGGIGGQAFSTFTVEAWVDTHSEEIVEIFMCAGMYHLNIGKESKLNKHIDLWLPIPMGGEVK